MKIIKVLKSKVDNIMVYLSEYTEYNPDYWEIIDFEIDDEFNPDVDEINSFLER